MNYIYNEKRYLAHHGIFGQKWGKRNGPPYPLNPERRDKIIDGDFKEVPKNSASAKLVKKDKENKKTIESLNKNANTIIRTSKNIYDSQRKLKEKNDNSDFHNSFKEQIKGMSDEELRTKINRLDMERRYESLTREEIMAGKKVRTNYLDLAGDVLAIGISAATLVGLILTLKKSK